MLFAFRIIMSQAILRLHKVQAARLNAVRHGPPALSPGARRARVRLAHRWPRHLPQHHGPTPAHNAAPPRPEATEQPPRPPR